MAANEILKDVKVLEFGQIVAGPLVSTYLSDYGAEVVHIEAHKRPDQYRLYPPFKDNKPGINRGFQFAVYSHNKYGITLDLQKPIGVEVAKRIIKNWANVVVENFTPGVMARLGLGYEELKKIRPDIIMLSSCNMGQTGPYAKHPGMGSHLSHYSGFTHLSGWADRDPLILFGPYIDFIGVVYGIIGVMTALEHRRQTGEGQLVDVAQFEGGVQFLSSALLDYTVNGRVQNRQGNRCDFAAPHAAYPCKGEDRWCVIAAFRDQEWEKLCEVMGEPGLAKDPKYSTLLARKKNEEELDRVIEKWTSNLTAEEVMDKLQSVGVEGAIVKNTREMYEDPHLQKYFWCEANHPEIGLYHSKMPPFKMSKTPARLRSVSPLLGEHNEYVYKKIAGFTDEEYDQLEKEGAFD